LQRPTERATRLLEIRIAFCFCEIMAIRLQMQVISSLLQWFSAWLHNHILLTRLDGRGFHQF
jgi:hypothetical protein